MGVNDGWLEKWTADRRATRDDRLRTIGAARSGGVPIPDDPLEFVRDHVYWPHKDNLTPVAGLNAIQRDYLLRRTAFRLDDEGHRLPGSDIVMKPRQVYFTSLVLALLIWAMIKFPGFQSVTVLHTAGKTARKLWSRMRFALQQVQHHHPDWGNISGQSAGEMLEWSNGSGWLLYTAGQGESIAEKLGRSIAIHALHLSESGYYAYPETVWGAAQSAMSGRTGWLIAECSPPREKTHWHAQEYYATRDGQGSFLRAFFWPWHLDPNCVIAPDDPRAKKVSAAPFIEKLGALEVEKERALALSLEQRLWRRWFYFHGTPRTTRKNRLEHPEDDETCFGGDEVVPYLHMDALDMVDAMTRDAVTIKRWTPNLAVYLWDHQGTPGHVVVGVDQASKGGRDRSAAEFIDWETGDQLAEIHGHCFSDEFVAAIDWTLVQLGAVAPNQHTLIVDRNRDFGLTRELENNSRLTAWRKSWRNPKTHVLEKAREVGLFSDDRIRPQIINAISWWVEGQDEQEGEISGPQCKILSSRLASELRTMTDLKGKVQAAPTYHDDLVMAWGMALYMRERVKPRVSIGGQQARRAPIPYRAGADRCRAATRRGGPS